MDRRRNTLFAGKVAGGPHSGGYLGIKIDGKTYLAHRVAYLWMTGELTENVSHRSDDFADNRWANLCAATRSQCISKGRGWSSRKSKFRGVSREGSRWQAASTKGGVIHRVGTHDTEEGAARAYDEKALELHGEFARLNFPNPLPKAA
jgi:hypothetical protein